MLGTTFLLSDGILNFSQPWLTNLYCPEKAPVVTIHSEGTRKCFTGLREGVLLQVECSSGRAVEM